jgi:hypothetical protein
MKRWLADVAIQTRTKSYPHRATVRIEAGQPAIGFKRAYEAAVAQYRHALKRRAIEFVTIRLTALGVIDRPTGTMTVEGGGHV